MAGTMGSARGRGGTIAAINVTPLVDVVLVLLIILMVASTYIVAQTLKVTLPKSKSTDGTADKPQTVAILKDGSLRWNDAPVSEKATDVGYEPVVVTAKFPATPTVNVVDAELVIVGDPSTVNEND